jgi:Spondin_N
MQTRLLCAQIVRCLLLCTLPSPIAALPASATYQIRFESDWSANTHPGAYPANAHYSALTGASHKHGTRLWFPGMLATPGIESMAETGGTGVLTSEIQSLMAAGFAASVINGSGAVSPGTATINSVVVGEDFPEISLVTMLAPSPDWFTGVHGVSMIADAQWRPTLSVDLFPYDSGTDNGLTFTALDIEAVPHTPIIRVADVPALNNGTPLGRFIFTLQSNSGPPNSLFIDGMETAAP